VAPEGIHLTLRFLGWVADDRVAALSQGLGEASAGFEAFELTAAGVGCFPSCRRPGVLWVGLERDVDQLCALQARVESGVRRIGFEADRHPFHPHLTLARVGRTVSAEARARIGSAVKSAGIECVCCIDVRRVSLMRSQLTPSGAVYTCLREWSLGQSSAPAQSPR
jgi:2'-5' RNA ligase